MVLNVNLSGTNILSTCCFVFDQGSSGQIGLFWGIAADGSVVVSENLDLIKASCAKSFAPFPTGMQKLVSLSFAKLRFFLIG